MKKIMIILMAFLLAPWNIATAQEVKNGIITLDPPTILRPARYSHGKVVPMNAQMLFTAGQVGADINGNYPDTIEEQADQAFKTYTTW